MQQAVQTRPIKKGKIDRFGANIPDQSGKICVLGPFGGTDVIRNFRSFEVVKNVKAVVHAAWAERTLFLGEIVKRNVFEGDVVQIKVATKLHAVFDQFREPP